MNFSLLKACELYLAAASTMLTKFIATDIPAALITSLPNPPPAFSVGIRIGAVPSGFRSPRSWSNAFRNLTTITVKTSKSSYPLTPVPRPISGKWLRKFHAVSCISFCAIKAAGALSLAGKRFSRAIPTGATCFFSTNIFTATMAPVSAPAIRPAGPVSSRNSSSRAVNNMLPLQFREATLQDEAALMPMMGCLAEHQPGAIIFDEPAARSAFRQFLSLPAFGRAWLLYTGPALVGYIVLTIGFSFEFHGHDAFIDELYIAPDHRRRGFGRQALAIVEQKAREMGVNATHLAVARGNDSALALSRRSGYRDPAPALMTKCVS